MKPACLAFLALSGAASLAPTLDTQSQGPLASPARAAGEPWGERPAADRARAEYAFTPVRAELGVWSAPCRAQELRSRVSARGLEVFPRATSASGVGATWRLRLATQAFGRGPDVCELGSPFVAVHGARAELDHGGLVEWFENGERGIEHGWTIAVPAGGAGELWIGLELGGDLSLSLSNGARSAELRDGSGVSVLRYEHLAAWDAAGRELPARLGWGPTGVGVAVDDTDAAYPVTVDPVLSLGWTAEPDQSGAKFGGSVSSAVDVNGDGYDDVIIGAREYDNGEIDEGRAFVYLGSASGLGTNPAWTAESDQATAYFGGCVSTAGDVNGDGYDDVIVGASVFNVVLGDEGRACVYLGSPGGLSTSADWVLDGQQMGERLGFSVSGAGDVNGDGYDDVVVGAPGYDGASNQAGRAFVYLGSPSGLSTTPTWMAEGTQLNEDFGEAVSCAGDVNGDGYDDVIVGAPGYTNGLGQEFEGRASLYLGSVAGPSSSPAWTAESNQRASGYGGAVGGAGDVNGDGYDDVIVGADHYEQGVLHEEGKVFVYIGSASGPGATPGWTARGNQDDALFGYSVSTAGDVDGNGYDDVIVGAPFLENGQFHEGHAFVYLGSPAGLATTAAWTAEGNQTSALFGTAVSAAGDVNGDGYDDVIVGASSYDNPQAAEGRAFVYLGQSTASHSIRNGNGTNPLGYRALSEPVLGTSWMLEVDIAGPGHAGSIVTFGLGGPLSGPTLNGLVVGQLLARGPFLLDVAAGAHAIPLPADPSLAGATLPTQGATLDPGVVVLNNAIDATLGF